MYPDAWYLHIVRDREAVARSLMRAPWIADRSYDACAAVWDMTVNLVRTTFGDLEHYRELSYEELRADPGDALRPIFEWLGVSSDEVVLETARVLSRQQFSDLAAVPPAPSRLRASLRPRALAASARAALRRQLARGGEQDGNSGGAVAFNFVRGLREGDADALRALTAPTFELELRSPDDDVALRGDEARDALHVIAERAFARSYVREWWVSAGGPGEWWASAAGKPFWTLFLSALGGDATRVDIAVCLALEDNLIRRVVVISAGPLAGRPVVSAN